MPFPLSTNSLTQVNLSNATVGSPPYMPSNMHLPNVSRLDVHTLMSDLTINSPICF